MDDDFDKALQNEIDEFCTALLKEIAALDSAFSRKLTRRMKNVEILGGGKRGRKFGKIAIVYGENRPLYERATEALRSSPEWRTFPPDPTVSAFYRSVYKLISEFRYPGSVEMKDANLRGQTTKEIARLSGSDQRKPVILRNKIAK